MPKRDTPTCKRALAALLLLCCAVAHGRTLSWDSLDVTAYLESDGRLHVIERQAMRFDGDWNGGERRFQVGPGQGFEFVGLFEIDSASSVRAALRRGSLARVGNFDFTDAHTLRWRARLPTDPPFRNALRVYEIEYVLAGVVHKSTEGYALAHDFAFPDRTGEIGHFSARLGLDPIWQAAVGSSMEIHGDHLAPGQGAIMRLQLDYLGSTAPAAIAPPDSAAGFSGRAARAATLEPHWLALVPAWRYAMLVALALFVTLNVAAWYRHERELGKYAPLTAAERIDPAWLQANVFSHPPEVVGAAWDLKTSASEVAAVLARLTQEKKLASEVLPGGQWFWRSDNLRLKLLVARDSLSSYERELIDQLFFDDSTTTDTEAIREHYKSGGFDPADTITAGLKRKLASLLGSATRVPRWRRQTSLVLVLAGAALLVAQIVMQRDTAIPLGFFALPALFAYVFARFAAENYQQSVAAFVGTLFELAFLTGVLLALVVASACLSLYAWGAGQFIAFTLLAAGLLNSIVNASYTRDSAHSISLRKYFAAARTWFVRELKMARPQLRDEWYPYLLGFGLGSNVDRWFRAQRAASIASVASGGGMSSHASATSWTGGGGTFGGGGASGSWASAVGGMAASVAAPGSGGSSGGGGGSSGGGGGGGW